MLRNSLRWVKCLYNQLLKLLSPDGEKRDGADAANSEAPLVMQVVIKINISPINLEKLFGNMLTLEGS